MDHANLLKTLEDDLGSAISRARFSPQLGDACRHAVLGGGKRVRPILLFESTRAAGGHLDDARFAATALELIHAFSLVHDDLPALDNDLVRRGLPTVHAKYGEALAILAGDALLALAFENAAQSPHSAGALLRELSSATMRMIDGQCLDTLGGFAAGTSLSEQLEFVHANKTGALFRCATALGGIAARADQDLIRALSTFGSALGLMFQIIDDIIDETQTTEHAGKATGKDRDAGKLTYPVVHGIPASRAEVGRLEQLAREALELVQSHNLGSIAGLSSILDRCVSRTN